MGTWTKAILIGIAAAMLALFLPQLVTSNKKNSFFARKADYYKVHCLLDVIPNDGGSNSRILNSAMDNCRLLLKNAGFNASVTITDKLQLDIRITDMLPADIPYINSLLTGNSQVEFRELYQANEIENGLLKLIEVSEKYMPEKTKPLSASPPKNAEPDSSIKTQYPLKVYEGDESPLSDAPAENVASVIQFMTQPAPGGLSGHLRFPAEIAIVNLKDTALLNSILKDSVVRRNLPSDSRFCYGTPQKASGENNIETVSLYVLRTRGHETAILGNEEIEDAHADYNQLGDPEISLQFNKIGTRLWARMTADNVDRPLAIIYNNKVTSAPYVEGRIEGGASRIMGNFTIQEIKVMCAQMKSEHIPATYSILSLEKSKQISTTIFNLLGRAVIVFVIAAAGSLFIFKMLKNS